MRLGWALCPKSLSLGKLPPPDHFKAYHRHRGMLYALCRRNIQADNLSRVSFKCLGLDCSDIPTRPENPSKLGKLRVPVRPSVPVRFS